MDPVIAKVTEPFCILMHDRLLLVQPFCILMHAIAKDWHGQYELDHQSDLFTLSYRAFVDVYNAVLVGFDST